MTTTRLFILLPLVTLVVMGYLRGQSEAAERDSLLGVTETLDPVDHADLRALYELGRMLIWTEKDLARQYAETLITRARARQTTVWEAKGLRIKSNLFLTTGKYDSALLVNQAAIDLTQTLVGEESLLISLYLNRGVYYQTATDYEKAINEYVKAYELSETYEIEEHLGKIFNNLGVLYRRIQRPKAARKSYQKALELKIAEGDSLGMANSLNNLGIVEMELGEEEVSILTFQRAKKVYLALGEVSEARSVDLSLGQAYYNTKKYALAKSTWELALNEPDLRTDAKTYTYVCLGLGDIYLQKGQLTEAEAYFDEGLNYASGLQIPRLLADLTRGRAQVFQQRGRVDSASVYFSSYAEQIDTVIEAERLKEQQIAAEEFESKLREAEIARQSLIIERQQQRQILLWIGIIGTALIALGIFLVYYFRLQFQKSESQRQKEIQRNKLTELAKANELSNLRAMIEGQEAERRRVAKDLHDGLGGLLATVKARMSGGNTANQEADKLLDHACTEVRRIAHNMAPQTLALAGLSGAVADICAQLNLRGLDCEYEISGQPDQRLDENGQIMLIRIIQELTHNVVKHAQAKRVFLQLLDQPDQLLLIVEDDGIGFDVAAQQQGLGLKSIKSRAAYLNGELLYDSSKGHGTTINLSIPI